MKTFRKNDIELPPLFITKTLKHSESKNELDLELIKDFGYDYDKHDYLHTIEKGKQGYFTEGDPIRTETVIEIMHRMIDKGVTHLELVHHEGHNGYVFNGYEIRFATEKEINKEQKNILANDEAENKISELEAQIEKIRNSLNK